MRDKLIKFMQNRGSAFGRPMTSVEIADGWIAALPNMVPELVWEDCPDFFSATVAAKTYRSGQYRIGKFESGYCVTGFPQFVGQRFDTLDEAKAAANAHHAAALMSSLGIEGA